MAGEHGQMAMALVEVVELRAALLAERRARLALERRLAEMAHDLRAALASIAGYAQMLAEGGRPPLSPAQIGRRIARVAGVLRDIGDDALAQDGVQHRQRLRSLLTACAETIAMQCHAKGLALRLGLPAAGELGAGAPAVRRIVLNLLTNAVRYTERGEVYLGGALTPGGLEIEVRDTGIGIPPQHLERIFGAYQRLDDARRLAPLGTGLGLTTVKHLCERLRGRIEVESTPGAGSTFRLRLPRRRRRRYGKQASLQWCA